MTQRRGRQTSLGGEIERLAARLGGPDRAAHSRLAAAWADVVGPAIAGHTIVLGGRRGELVIGVDSPAWASELSLMAEDLLERVRQESGNTPVRGIRFAVTRDAQRSHAVAAAEEATASGYEVRVEPVPLDEAEMNRVRESVADVKDASLREAALRAIVADLEWKKGISSANGREGGAPRPTGRKSD